MCIIYSGSKVHNLNFKGSKPKHNKPVKHRIKLVKEKKPLKTDSKKERLKSKAQLREERKKEEKRKLLNDETEKTISRIHQELPRYNWLEQKLKNCDKQVTTSR